jgi:GNAT superfamily N-acetyltransferase
MVLRPMQSLDLPAAARLQDICYPPALRDSGPALHSRIALRDHCCVVATAGDDMLGYILAHPWPTMNPPLPDTVLRPPADGKLIHYIHDLSVDPRARSSGVGRKLVAMSHAMARASGLAWSELIAIDGAAPYWLALGYDVLPMDGRIARKVASYGSEALYLGRND